LLTETSSKINASQLTAQTAFSAPSAIFTNPLYVLIPHCKERDFETIFEVVFLPI
jgi:hypothetical protein